MNSLRGRATGTKKLATLQNGAFLLQTLQWRVVTTRFLRFKIGVGQHFCTWHTEASKRSRRSAWCYINILGQIFLLRIS